MTETTPFGEGVWLVDGPRIRMFTIPFDTRMTVVRLAGGGLWVHSPTEPTDEVRAAVDALGPVEYIIAPNKLHSLGVTPWHQLYPAAEVWVSPRFSERHPGLHVDHVLASSGAEPWLDEIDQHAFGGSSFFDEVVFLHRRSKTLILTDLVQRHDPSKESWFWRLVKGATGVLGDDGGTARDLRAVFRDRTAARESAAEILTWDFEQVIISHGRCITERARAQLERAFAWALAPSASA